MKKILYIIPIVVFAMVGLTQDAKAQTGQTGNASNAITQGATNAVTAAALLTTTTGPDNNIPNVNILGLNIGDFTSITPPTNAPVVIFQGSGGISVFVDNLQYTPLSSETTNRIVVGSSIDDRIVTPARSSTIVGLNTNIDYSVTVTADHHALITKFLIGS